MYFRAGIQREIEDSSKCGAVIVWVREERDQGIGRRKTGCGQLTGLDQSLLNHSCVFEATASKDGRASVWLGRSQGPSVVGKRGRSQSLPANQHRHRTV